MVVARKNVRDFRGSVINPRDHYVLPDKRRLSRNDVSELLSNQQFWIDNPHMRSLIPQLLDYMVSPWKGAPTVAKKVRGGGIEAVLTRADNPALTSLLTGHYARRSPTHLHPQRDPVANTPPYFRNQMTTPTTFGRSPIDTDTMRDSATKRKNDRDHEVRASRYTPIYPHPYTPIYHQPSTFPDPFVRATVTGFPDPPSNDPFAAEPPPGVQVNAPPRRRRARRAPPAPPPAPPPEPPALVPPEPPAPPAAPPAPPAEPPAPPIPPLNVPVYPVAPNDTRSPFHKLLDEAMRLNSSSAVKKLYGLVGNNNAHTLTLQQVVTATGLSEEEVQRLTRIPENHLYGSHDNTTISSNGVPVVHVHNSTYQPFSGPPRPLMIKTNSGTAQIKVR